MSSFEASTRERLTELFLAWESVRWEEDTLNAEQVVEAVEAVYGLFAPAIERVKECHPRDDSNPRGPWCPTCLTAWPCKTITALDGQRVNDNDHYQPLQRRFTGQ